MSDQVDTGRRQFLTVATIATGAVGAAFAAVPFLASWKPSARAKALGAPVEVDISKVDPGAMIKVDAKTAHRVMNSGPITCRFLLLQGVGRFDYLPVGGPPAS